MNARGGAPDATVNGFALRPAQAPPPTGSGTAAKLPRISRAASVNMRALRSGPEEFAVGRRDVVKLLQSALT